MYLQIYSKVAFYRATIRRTNRIKKSVVKCDEPLNGFYFKATFPLFEGIL